MLTEEQLAQAIASLDSHSLSKLVGLLPLATARSLIGAAARRHPPRQRIDDFERTLEGRTKQEEVITPLPSAQ